MGIGTSLVLIAVGAILAFAVNLHSTIGSTVVHWSTVGWILILVGVVGLVITLILFANARRGSAVVTRERVVDGDPYRP